MPRKVISTNLPDPDGVTYSKRKTRSFFIIPVRLSRFVPQCPRNFLLLCHQDQMFHQMYSVTQILHPHKDRQGRQRVQIRIIYNRARVYLKTEFKVSGENPKINSIVRKRMAEAEDRLLDAIKEGLTTEGFKRLFKEEKAKSVCLSDYFTKLIEDLQGKLSPGTLRQYRVMKEKIGTSVTFADVSVKWLQDFEKGLKGLDGNTVNSNMKRIRAMLSKAEADGYITKDKFSGYKVPPYKQKLVDFLTEKEIAALDKVVRAVNVKSKRIAGYYFLLSCYTGWRIGDVKKFNLNMIRGNRLVLRASKNNNVVSIPVHSRLKEVLKFTNKNSFDLSEEKARLYVKELCGLAGIHRNVKFNHARHSFAMLLMANGFTIDEVAELIGDSPLIAKVYAKIHNESLDKKIRERLG